MYSVISGTYNKSCSYDHILYKNYIIDFIVNIGAILGPVLFSLVLDMFSITLIVLST